MSVVLTTIRYLQAEGFPAEKILELVAQLEEATERAETAAFEAGEQVHRSAGAIRQARYRARRASQVTVSDVTGDVTGDVTRYVTPPALNDTPEPNSKPSEFNLNPPPYSPPARAAGRVLRLPKKPDYPDEFRLLWDEFPKHPNASKSEALRRWEQLDPGDRENCLTGAMRYADFLASERRKRPDYPGLHLATFIFQRRWESHIEAAE